VIGRTFDAAYINSLVNHPDIRPHIGGDGESVLDLSAAVNDRANVFLVGDHGGFAFSWSAPFVYDVHALVLPSGSGKWARDSFALARDAMCDIYGARILWVRIEPDNRKTIMFARRAGFIPSGKHTLDLGAGPVTYDLFTWGF
jgi:hypothetical protein